jgi:CHASE3 domain sensor protein
MQKKILIGFGVAAVLLVVFGIMAYRVSVGFIETSALVAHTHEVMGLLQSIEASIDEAETSQRGYVITGQARAATRGARMAISRASPTSVAWP